MCAVKRFNNYNTKLDHAELMSLSMHTRKEMCHNRLKIDLGRLMLLLSSSQLVQQPKRTETIKHNILKLCERYGYTLYS